MFFVTINSNKVPRSNVHDDLLVRVCQEATQITFDEATIAEAFKFVFGFEGDTYEQTVRSYRFNGNVEVGARQNYAVHSHVTLLVQHNSRLQLRPEVLRRRFIEAWNGLCHRTDRIQSCYLDIKAASHAIANWILYQQKDQASGTDADIPVQSSDPRTGTLQFIATDLG